MNDYTDLRILDIIESITGLRSRAEKIYNRDNPPGVFFSLLSRDVVAKEVICGLTSAEGSAHLRGLFTSAGISWEMHNSTHPDGTPRILFFWWRPQQENKNAGALGGPTCAHASTEGEAVLQAFCHAVELGYIK